MSMLQDRPQLDRALDLAGIPPDGRTVQFSLAPPDLRDGNTAGASGNNQGLGQGSGTSGQGTGQGAGQGTGQGTGQGGQTAPDQRRAQCRPHRLAARRRRHHRLSKEPP